MDLFTLFLILNGNSGSEELGKIEYSILNQIFGTSFTEDTAKQEIIDTLEIINSELETRKEEYQNIINELNDFFKGGE